MRLHSADYRIKQHPCRLLFIVPASVMPACTVLCFGIKSLVIIACHSQELVEHDDIECLYNIQKCCEPLESLSETEIFTAYIIGILLHCSDKISAEQQCEDMPQKLFFL